MEKRFEERTHPEVESLLMSGYATDSHTGEAGAEGVTEILHKPFKRVDLARRIRAILDRGRRADGIRLAGGRRAVSAIRPSRAAPGATQL